MKNKKALIVIIFIILISLLGVTYAFFEYYGISADYEVKAGAVTLTLNEGKDYIDLTNIFPETKEEARLREDNIISFTISGVNTTENKDIYYEIMLNEGDEVEGLTRFLPKELMFDLTEINPDGTEKLVVDNMNFGDFNATRIWVNTILRENETEFTRTYELRMWLSDKVLISDTYEGADYTTSEFRQRYASVRVSVFGDFNEKSAPYNYLAKINTSSSAFWPTAINNVRSSISEVNFVSLPQSEIDARYEAATIKEDVTDTTKGGSVLTWLETYTEDETKYVMYVASDGITYFPSNSSSMFSSFSNLKEINFENINTSKVTAMYDMFNSCINLTSIDLSNFDTSQVAFMQRIFYGCSRLTDLDVSSFDTNNATNMSYMFFGCRMLMGVDLSSFNTSNVTNMAAMFSDCSSLTDLDVSDFDTGQVTDMSGMFSGCSSLTIINVKNFDTRQVTNMEAMFSGCIGLINIDVSNFDTINVKLMGNMFSGCSGLSSIDVSNFDTSQVTSMHGMFTDCSGLTSIDVSNFDTDQVTSMGYMFYGCTGLNILDLSVFNTVSLTNTMYMFRNCSNLITIYSNIDWNSASIANSKNMFYGCGKLIGAISYKGNGSGDNDIIYANPTTGYFTIKPTEETPAA